MLSLRNQNHLIEVSFSINGQREKDFSPANPYQNSTKFYPQETPPHMGFPISSLNLTVGLSFLDSLGDMAGCFLPPSVGLAGF